MARAPAIFRQTDITRAVKGALAAGIAIARVEIDASGKIVVVAERTGGDSIDELDQELSAFEAAHD